MTLAAIACVDLSWKPGIACDVGDRCPGALTCCDDRTCQRQCAPTDAAATTDGPQVVICPAEIGACFGCMPGCACACAGTTTSCCLKFGVATCGGC